MSKNPIFSNFPNPFIEAEARLAKGERVVYDATLAGGGFFWLQRDVAAGSYITPACRLSGPVLSTLIEEGEFTADRILMNDTERLPVIIPEDRSTFKLSDPFRVGETFYIFRTVKRNPDGREFPRSREFKSLTEAREAVAEYCRKNDLRPDAQDSWGKAYCFGGGMRTHELSLLKYIDLTPVEDPRDTVPTTFCIPIPFSENK